MKWRSLEESAGNTDIRPLREILVERKEMIAKYVPAETQAIHARVVAELRDRNFTRNILSVGAKAPAFELPDHQGKLIRAADLLTKGRLVLCFIRGRWCPFCVGQMEAMNPVATAIQDAGASVVAISPQTVQQSFFMHDQHKLRFPLLSDSENKLGQQFGLIYQVPEYQQQLYRRVFVKLPFVNGDESWTLPVPAVYIIGHDGTIQFASANEDYTERVEPAEILRLLSL